MRTTSALVRLHCYSTVLLPHIDAFSTGVVLARCSLPPLHGEAPCSRLPLQLQLHSTCTGTCVCADSGPPLRAGLASVAGSERLQWKNETQRATEPASKQ